MFKIIENEQIEAYIRASVLATFSILYLEGVKSRDFIIDYFRKLINQAQDVNDDYYMLLLNEIINLKLVELVDDVKKNYDKIEDTKIKDDFE